MDRDYLGAERSAAVESLEGQSFEHAWQIERALADASSAWRSKEPRHENDAFNKALDEMRDYLRRPLATAGQ